MNEEVPGFNSRAIKSIATRARVYWAGGQFNAKNVPSPCSSVCVMDEASGWCKGCLRTLDEIGNWSALDDAGKARVWVQIGQRADVLTGPAA